MPLRSFGSITKATITAMTPQFQFCPCLRLLGTAAYDYSASKQVVRLNAAAEGIVFAFRVPNSVVLEGKTVYFRLIALDRVGPSTGLMNVGLTVDSAGTTNTANVQGEWENPMQPAEDQPAWALDAVEFPTLAAEDYPLSVIVLYAAAGAGGAATNLDVWGAEIFWE